MFELQSDHNRHQLVFLKKTVLQKMRAATANRSRGTGSERLAQAELENKRLLKELSLKICGEQLESSFGVINVKKLISSPQTTREILTHQLTIPPPLYIIEELETSSRKLLLDTSLQAIKGFMLSYEASKRKSVMLKIQMKPGSQKSSLQLSQGEWWIDAEVADGENILGVECHNSRSPQLVAESFRRRHFRVVVSAKIKILKTTNSKPKENSTPPPEQIQPEIQQQLPEKDISTIASLNPVFDDVWDLTKSEDRRESLCDRCSGSLTTSYSRNTYINSHDRQQQTTPTATSLSPPKKLASTFSPPLSTISVLSSLSPSKTLFSQHKSNDVEVDDL